MLSPLADSTDNTVLLQSAPDINQSLFEFFHIIEHKPGHSVLNIAQGSLNQILHPFSYRELKH